MNTGQARRIEVVAVGLEADGPTMRQSLVAQEEIPAGETIFLCSSSEMTRERTFRTIQIGFNLHLRNPLLDYVNHSCEPNAVFDVARLALVSIRPVAAGRSITFFYPGSEVELATEFHCRCGATTCIGEVLGGFYLSRRQMRWAVDSGYCTAFIRQRFEKLLESGLEP